MDYFPDSGVTFKSYKYKAELLVKDYLLADSYIQYTAILCGILMCKMAYDITHLISSQFFNRYASLAKMQRTEWNNRGMSTVHAIYITAMAAYFVFFSELFSDHGKGLVSFQSSNHTHFTLGVSVGYFLTDLGMIVWFYPSLGRMEYILHHLLSLVSIVYSIISCEGQYFVLMVLMSEATTPEINLRWYLDVAGMKRSKAYIVNGVAIFTAWLVARILLFLYLFYQIYVHYYQISQMSMLGYLMMFLAPGALFVMNAAWFMKIVRGLQKTLAKRH